MESSVIEPDRAALDTVLNDLEGYRIDLSRIEFCNETAVQRGGYGVVRKAQLKPEGEVDPVDVAVKELISDDRSLDRIAFRLARELKVWADLDHPNVLKLLAFHLSDDLEYAYLICPWYPFGNLNSYIQATQPNEQERLRLVKDTARGLAYLHTLKPRVCHGDLKGANVLMNPARKAVLADFGLTTLMGSSSSGLTTSRGFKGSIRWCSWEILDGDDRTLYGDIWAWGCLVLEIMMGKVPYCHLRSDAQVVASIMGHNLPAPEDDLPACVRPIVARSWTIRPASRPDMADINDSLAHLEIMQWLRTTILSHVDQIDTTIMTRIKEAEATHSAACEMAGTLGVSDVQLHTGIKAAESALSTPTSATTLAYLQLRLKALNSTLDLSVSLFDYVPPIRPMLNRVRTQSAPAQPVTSDLPRDPWWDICSHLDTLRALSPYDGRERLKMTLAVLSLRLDEVTMHEERDKVVSLGELVAQLCPHQSPMDRRAAFAQKLGTTFVPKLVSTGRLQAALDGQQEVNRIYRELHEEAPSAYAVPLARALNATAKLMDKISLTQEALATIEEALPLLRSLAKNNAPKSSLALADCLCSHYSHLFNLERFQDSLLALEDAIELYRSTYDADSSTNIVRLTTCLQCLEILHDFLQRKHLDDCALRALKQIVRLQRFLSAVQPQLYLPKLAASLEELSKTLVDKQEAKTCLEEDELVYQRLVAEGGDGRYPELVANCKAALATL